MTHMAQNILHETEGLSRDALQEVLDFIRFLKFKEQRTHKQPLTKEQDIHQTLRTSEADSLAHLEEEFANYKELYPHEAGIRDGYDGIGFEAGTAAIASACKVDFRRVGARRGNSFDSGNGVGGKQSSAIDDIPELHDRLIAGTAATMKIPLNTNDPVITNSQHLTVVWGSMVKTRSTSDETLKDTELMNCERYHKAEHFIGRGPRIGFVYHQTHIARDA